MSVAGLDAEPLWPKLAWTFVPCTSYTELIRQADPTAPLSNVTAAAESSNRSRTARRERARARLLAGVVQARRRLLER